LDSLLKHLEKGYYGLQHGDSELQLPGGNRDRITNMFEDIHPYFLNIHSSANKLIEIFSTASRDAEPLQTHLSVILQNENDFFERMDKIVHQFDLEAKKKLNFLKMMELLLFSLTISVLFLEGIFIFR